MQRVVLLAITVAACGGKPPPPPLAPAPAAPEPVAKRVPVEDSDSDDGVTYANQHGRMDPAAVQAGIAPHQSELSDCYMNGYKNRRWLGGHVVIHWDIRKDGTVTAVKLMQESDLGAWPIEKCLLDVARSATFDKPQGGDADFTLPLEFEAKGRALAWNDDQTLRAVGGQLARLDTCNKKAPPPPDEVTITAYIGPAGHAQSVGFSSDKSEIAEKWAECAVKTVMSWRLPDPRGQVAKLAIKYR
jgi:hypothetical protein